MLPKVTEVDRIKVFYTFRVILLHDATAK